MPRATKAEIKERRNKVALARLSGVPILDISRNLGVSKPTVDRDIFALKTLPPPNEVTAMLYPIHGDVLTRSLDANELRTALAAGKQIHEIYGVRDGYMDVQLTVDLAVDTPPIHDGQANAKEAPTRYMMLRAGRRWGKTLLAAVVAAEMLRDGQRCLYVAPQVEQTREFWRYLRSFVSGGVRITDNPRRASIDGQDGEIRALSSWNGDGLRGSEADLIIMDEAQLQDHSVVEEVIMPMLVSTNGRLWLIFTPPSLDSLASSRAEDKTWINRYWSERTERHDWTQIIAPSAENPKNTPEAIEAARLEMSELRFRVEMLAEPLDDIPGALWRTEMIRYCADHVGAHSRYDLMRVVVGVDPAGGKGDVGIVVVGIDYAHRLVVLDDDSVSSQTNSPQEWAITVSNAYHRWEADAIVVERNFGADMAIAVLEMSDPEMRIIETTSSKGKYVRAEPIALMYERDMAYHCKPLPELEKQMTSWLPDNAGSPDRLDALVFAANELAIDGEPDMDEVYRLLGVADD